MYYFFNNGSLFFQGELEGIDPVVVFKQSVAACKWVAWSASVEAADCRRDIFNITESSTLRKTPQIIKYKTVATSKFQYAYDFICHDGSSFTGYLDEEKLTRHLYCNANVYAKFGKHFCIAYDVALGKGGSEAVVESLYSVMKAQSSYGGQSNDVLVKRTMIDWHCPSSPLGIMNFINEAADIHQQKHKQPIAKLNFGLSKVMTRLKEDTGKIPDV